MDRSYIDLLQDESVGYIHDFSGQSDVALLAFGALNQNPTIPVFEFFNLLKDVDVNKAFIRDLDQVFYQNGVKGLGGSIPEVARNLRRLLSGTRRAVFVGGSAGGYAALLYGTLLGVDEVVVASPQTFLNHTLRRFYGDRRWPDRIAAIYGLPNLQRRYLNLKRVLRGKSEKTRYRIYYASGNRLDGIHVNRLGHMSNVTLYSKPGCSHNIFREMRDSGMLKPMLMEIVMGDGERARTGDGQWRS